MRVGMGEFKRGDRVRTEAGREGAYMYECAGGHCVRVGDTRVVTDSVIRIKEGPTYKKGDVVQARVGSWIGERTYLAEGPMEGARRLHYTTDKDGHAPHLGRVTPIKPDKPKTKRLAMHYDGGVLEYDLTDHQSDALQILAATMAGQNYE